MAVESLDDVEREVERLAQRLGASGSLLPTFGRSEDSARPHVEVDPQGYHYVVVERGIELSRRTTSELDELLYHIFRDVAFALAGDHELRHRVPGRDPRRLLFQKQWELLRGISEAWSRRVAADHERVLREHPFDDASGARVQLTLELGRAGHSSDAAWQQACRRFPLPGGR